MNSIDTPSWIENVTYDELSVGQSAHLRRTLTLADIQAFAAVSGEDRKSTRLNSSHIPLSRMPSSA